MKCLKISRGRKLHFYSVLSELKTFEWIKDVCNRCDRVDLLHGNVGSGGLLSSGLFYEL